MGALVALEELLEQDLPDVGDPEHFAAPRLVGLLRPSAAAAGGALLDHDLLDRAGFLQPAEGRVERAEGRLPGRPQRGFQALLELVAVHRGILEKTEDRHFQHRYIGTIYHNGIAVAHRPRRRDRPMAGSRLVPVRGYTDYTLAKRALLREFEEGRLTRYDICDAHRDLLRAARYYGEETQQECPVCADGRLMHVPYAFGEDLKRRNGRCFPLDELRVIGRDVDEFTCYVVEVCMRCSWNHLALSYVMGRRAG